LRVFTWTPPDKVVKVPVPVGDNNLEVQALEGEMFDDSVADDEETRAEEAEDEVADAVAESGRRQKPKTTSRKPRS